MQRNAMKANEEGLEFKEVVAADEKVLELLGPGELDLCFDISYHLRNVDAIFARLGL